MPYTDFNTKETTNDTSTHQRKTSDSAMGLRKPTAASLVELLGGEIVMKTHKTPRALTGWQAIERIIWASVAGLVFAQLLMWR